MKRIRSAVLSFAGMFAVILDFEKREAGDQDPQRNSGGLIVAAYDMN